MAGPLRRPVPNDLHPNLYGLPDEHWRYLLKLSKKSKTSIKTLILRAIEDSAKLRGEFVAAGHALRETCDDCDTRLIVGKSVDARLLLAGFVACKYCVSKAVQEREAFIREQERKAAERRRKAGAPVPLRRAVGAG